MADESTVPYRFGDLLALARRSRVRQLAAALEEAGHADYRRSDALAVRTLLPGPLPIGRFGQALGVTRQAARKVAAALQTRGYATVRRDGRDARRVNITLTDHGRRYAHAILDTLRRLDEDLARRCPPDRLAAADTVLRAVLSDEHSRALAARIPPPT